MDIKETGIILFCENYEAALEFYSGKLGLPVRKMGDALSVLDFGGSYLMLEDSGVASLKEKTRAENPTVIRFNVNNFGEAVAELERRGVFVDVKKLDWGTIGVVIDPEGNRIELKD
ncbi:VOC family protein [Paenibacillus sp. BK720]|uniref:VOC family protein n=1 Tax=Paenibacillus sp. BK720 TaxID=2587092 RepID=UPI001420A3D8|nr:VOC family protein [Paenibacillus sp. BK720]NIK66585.1 lactoylglutathione lyase [Paenibacillus sp. BK720]